MNAKIGLDKCLTFINCEIQPKPRPRRATAEGPRWRAVTISRQTGSGGHIVAEELAKKLQGKLCPEGRPWTVFDRNLVEKVLEDHHLPLRLARFMPEDRVSEMSDTIEELLGLHPPSYTLLRQTAETILRLADLGNVIIIGRGAHVITGKMDTVFHVRLVAPLETRIARVQETFKLSRKAAMEKIETEDRGKKRYLKKYFDADIDDPLQYHVVINTGRLPEAEAAELIARTLLEEQPDARR